MVPRFLQVMSFRLCHEWLHAKERQGSDSRELHGALQSRDGIFLQVNELCLRLIYAEK